MSPGCQRRLGLQGLLCMVVLAGLACTDDEAPVVDAGPTDAETVVNPVFEDKDTGTRFSWPTTWSRVAVDGAPDTDGVRTLGKIVRKRTATPVAPRLVLTTEPTTLDTHELVARRVKNVLRAQLESAGARVRRVGLSKRPLEGQMLGVLDLSYAVTVPDGAPTNIRHRSVIALSRTQDKQAVIVTLTATYLAKDHGLVGPEVDAVFNSFSIPSPTAAPVSKKEVTPP